MNAYFQTSIILNGESSPFTGQWVPMGKTRESLYTAYGNAVGGVILQYRSPFFPEEGITFHTLSVGGSGQYATPSFATSPMSEVRAISSGVGNFWCAITQQN